MPANEKPVKAKQCAMMIAVPLTEVGYYADLREPKEKKDFARSIGLFNKYKIEVISPVIRTAKILEAAGVSIFTEATLSDFVRLFDGRFDVIILFTHSCSQLIEFRDGLTSAENVVKQITTDFSGFIDLSVCHPIGLVKTLDRVLPNAICHYIDATVTPVLWMQYFLFLFKQLIDNPDLTYLKASVIAHHNLRALF
jgi:hypothetical protein